MTTALDDVRLRQLLKPVSLPMAPAATTALVATTVPMAPLHHTEQPVLASTIQSALGDACALVTFSWSSKRPVITSSTALKLIWALPWPT